jgi:hypothetical protein
MKIGKPRKADWRRAPAVEMLGTSGDLRSVPLTSPRCYDFFTPVKLLGFLLLFYLFEGYKVKRF